MKHFDYLRPESIDELVAVLRTYGPDARVLAGGTDLLVRLRKGHDAPRVVVDLKRVNGLSAQVEEAGGHLRIGARAVITDVIGNATVRRHFPALIEAALVVGSVQIRNRATIAGNICNASPAADTAPPLLAYGALVNLAGGRTIPLDQFFTGPGRTILERGDVVTSVDIPLPVGRAGAAFERLTRRHGVDLAIVSVCCAVLESGDARFAFGSVGPRPFVVSGRHETAIDEVVAHATPISDLRGAADYRRAMLAVLTRRARDRAVARLREGRA